MKVKLFILVTVTFAQVLSLCSPKNLKILGFTKRPRRSNPLILELSYKKCPGLNEFYYRWDIYDRAEKKILQTGFKPYFLVNGYTFPNENIFNKVLEIRGTISHYSNYEWSSSTIERIMYEPDDIYLEIAGGYAVSHPKEYDLIVDAESFSRDISFPPNYKMNSANGYLIEWKILPNLSGFSMKTLVLTIPYVTVMPFSGIYFNLSVTRIGIKGYISHATVGQAVEIKSNIKSSRIEIHCLKNCRKSNPYDTVFLKAVCKHNCQNLTFKFSTSNPTQNNQVKEKFIISEGFLPGDKISVLVRANFAHSRYDVKYVENVSAGVCKINPMVGVSGITYFTIECSDFVSQEGPMSYIIKQGNKHPENIEVDTEMYASRKRVLLSEGNSSVITILAIDSKYLGKEVKLNVLVKPYTCDCKFLTYEDSIKNLILGDMDNSVTSLAASNMRDQTVQAISYILDAMSHADFDKLTRKDLHKHLADSILKLQFHKTYTVPQLFKILQKVNWYRYDDDIKTQILIAKSMLKLSYSFSVIQNKFHVKPPTGVVTKYINEMMQFNSQLLLEVKTIKELLDKKDSYQDYDSYDEMIEEKLKIRDGMRHIFRLVIASSKILIQQALFQYKFGTPVLMKNTESFIIGTKYIQSNISLDDFNNYDIMASKAFIPSPKISRRHKAKEIVLINLKNNTLWWHENATKFYTDLLFVEIINNKQQPINLKKKIILKLFLNKMPFKKIKGTSKGSPPQLTVYRIKPEEGYLIVILFVNFSYPFQAMISDHYCWNEDLKKSTKIYKTNTILKAESEKFKSSMYLCIIKTRTDDLSYIFHLSAFSCKYHDYKTGYWKHKGCVVDDIKEIKKGFLKCVCNHLSLFAGQIIIPQHQINYNLAIDFHIALIRNWLMAVVVGVLLTVWLLLFLWAARRDKICTARNIICMLDDNVPGDEYGYLVVVFTGMFIDAGTTADVGFQIIGDNSSSRCHLIKCCGRKLLKRNSQDWFLIYTPAKLGKLQKIRLWHNSKGIKPHWYCRRVLIQELTSGEQYCFVVEKWFSLIWGRSKTYREIPLREKVILESRKILLKSNIEKQFKDKHLWLSVFSRDYQSNFTSKERVSCAICTLFISLLTSAILFGISENSTKDMISPNSAFYVTYTEVAIFIESWLVSFPIGIILSILFRNTPPHKKARL